MLDHLFVPLGVAVASVGLTVALRAARWLPAAGRAGQLSAAEGAILVTAALTDATVPQALIALTGPLAVALAASVRRLHEPLADLQQWAIEHGEAEPRPSEARHRFVLAVWAGLLFAQGVVAIAALDDWVFRNLLPRWLIAGLGLFCLDRGLDLAMRRPPFSWESVRGYRPPALSGGYARGDLAWVQMAPKHWERIELGPGRYLAAPPEVMAEYRATGHLPDYKRPPRDVAADVAQKLIDLLPWQISSPMLLGAGAVLLAAATPSPIQPAATKIAEQITEAAGAMVLLIAGLYVGWDLLRGRVFRFGIGAAFLVFGYLVARRFEVDLFP